MKAWLAGAAPRTWYAVVSVTSRVPYPKPIDVTTHHTSLTSCPQPVVVFALRPGDGIQSHSWSEAAMLLPDTVDTRRRLAHAVSRGYRLPAGSGLVASPQHCVMPLILPRIPFLVRVQRRNAARVCTCVTWYINPPTSAIPQEGHADRREERQENVFSVRILEIERPDNLTAEQAIRAWSDAPLSAPHRAVPSDADAKSTIVEYLEVTSSCWLMISYGLSGMPVPSEKRRARHGSLAGPIKLNAGRCACQ